MEKLTMRDLDARITSIETAIASMTQPKRPLISGRVRRIIRRAVAGAAAVAALVAAVWALLVAGIELPAWLVP